MTTLLRVPEEEREFFQWVAAAAFANPFGPQRRALDQKVAGASLPASSQANLQQALDNLAEHLSRLRTHGGECLRDFATEDRPLMTTVFLFDVFHRYCTAFDQWISDQLHAGDEPSAVPFARDTLDCMHRYGLPEPEAVRYFALIGQMRRAYFFIRHDLPGESPCMQELRIRLWNNLFTSDVRRYDQYLWNRMEDFSTLLLGATGTGKGTAANAIGRSGFIPFDLKQGRFTESFTRSFVSLNLSQYPETLIESELFGHVKGAFTGAIAPYEGIFNRCSPHGAIFLDEIGEVPPHIQIKLLRVLQERFFTPVGSHDKCRFSGRVIAATNRPMSRLRSPDGLRDDFYYRLCSDVIELPSLRQRLEEDSRELRRLVQHLLARLTGGEADALTEEVYCALTRAPGPDYPWPGNVRELEQAVRRILLTHTYEGDQHRKDPEESGDSWLGQVNAGQLTADQLLAGYCNRLYQRHRSYEEVARRTGLDRRTAKKYIRLPAG